MGIVSVKEAPDRRTAGMDQKGVRKYAPCSVWSRIARLSTA